MASSPQSDASPTLTSTEVGANDSNYENYLLSGKTTQKNN